MIYKRTKTLADDTVKEYPHWWYRFKRDGVQIQVNTKQGNRRTAEQLEAAHRTRLAKGEAGLHDSRDVPTLKGFKDRFIKALKARPKAAQFYQGRLEQMLKFAPLANARLDRIEPALIERYVQDRLPGRSVATVNRDLATLRRALRLAQEWKVINRVPRVRLLPGEKVREFVLRREDEAAYLAACPQPLKDVATLILDTGLRLGEALALEWSDVHLEPGAGKKLGFVQIRKGKTKNAKRAVSLTARASDLLKAITRVNHLVFPGGEIDKPYVNTSLAHLHATVRSNMNLPAEFVIHSLRHTFLTRLGEAGVDAFTIMRIAGHSSITVSQRYVHPSDSAMEAAFERVYPVGTPSVAVAAESPQGVD
jgi:integrase